MLHTAGKFTNKIIQLQFNKWILILNRKLKRTNPLLVTLFVACGNLNFSLLAISLIWKPLFIMNIMLNIEIVVVEITFSLRF